MTKWIKFSDRLPTENDTDDANELITMHRNGTWDTVSLPYTQLHKFIYEDYFWMENVPSAPKPRTLEEVAGDLCRTGFACDQSDEVRGLVNEMREILWRLEGHDK